MEDLDYRIVEGLPAALLFIRCRSQLGQGLPVDLPPAGLYSPRPLPSIPAPDTAVSEYLGTPWADSNTYNSLFYLARRGDAKGHVSSRVPDGGTSYCRALGGRVMCTTTSRQGHCSGETEFDGDRGVYFEKRKASRYMTDKELSKLPLLHRINWLSTTILVAPLVGLLIGSQHVPLRRPTAILAAAQYFLTALGITAGYHRLWSHRAYKAAWPVEFALLAWGAAAFQGSARWWCRNHRAHHRYVDTDQDPYCVRNGFWYAHVGWMILKQDTRRVGRVDISDLNAHRAVMFQHRHYLPIAVCFGFGLPIAVATVGWGDFVGALVYACFGRIFFLHQATSLVNSLAHTFGHQPYSKEHTSCDSIITACLTLGEGYHNYHHEFPHDYRNGICWYHYDPTKWAIRLLSYAGLCRDLLKFPANEIEKAKFQIQQQELESAKTALDWGVPLKGLPAMSWDELRVRSECGEHLVVVGDIVHKLDDFIRQHPGGAGILKFWNGRDATNAFNGEVYKHSKSARNLLAHFRIAKIAGVHN